MVEEVDELANKTINSGDGEKEISMSTSRRSLCFKLKVPKISEATTDPTTQIINPKEEEEEKEELLLGFVCPVCEKRFNSGKALGGHKRMHNINNKKKDKDKPVVVEEEEDVFECPECSKIFRSEKSVFGHMRSHPERRWRGIQPPPKSNSSSSSVVSDSPPLSLNWSVTAKRGRTTTTTTTTTSSASASAESSSRQVVVVPGMDEDMKEAVLDLMLLAHHKPKPTHTSEEDDDNKRKRPKMKLVDRLQKKQQEKNKYVCTSCDKWFSSYQALGGHRSSHNKLHSSTNTNNQSHRLFNFDLNELPPPEDAFLSS